MTDRQPAASSRPQAAAAAPAPDLAPAPQLAGPEAPPAPDDARVGWTRARDPGDLTKLLWYLLVTAAGLLMALGAANTSAGVEGDVVAGFAKLPSVVITAFMVLVLVLFIVLLLGIPISLLAMRRWRFFGIYTLGFVLTSTVAAVAERFLTDKAGSTATVKLDDLGGVAADFNGWPPAQTVATAVMALVLLSPHLSGAWRRFGWVFVASLSLLRVLTARDVALDIVLSIGIGGVIGSALMLAFGRRVPVPTPAGVLGALDRVGLHAITVTRLPIPARSSKPFAAVLADGSQLYLKVIGSSHYQADSLLRTYRRVRMREIGEDVAFSTVRRAAAFEAMLALSAARAGVRTPDVAGVAPLSDDEMVIAFEQVAGRGLDQLAPDEVTDELLDRAWLSVRQMREVGLAHRDLQAANWLLDDSGELWLIDFSYGEVAASDGALNTDIAELLAATYAIVGAQRAVAAAVRTLGPAQLVGGIGYLLPAALTRSTRAAVKGQPDGLSPLVAEASRACGVDEPTFAPIERVKPRTLIMAGLLAVAIYVLLPQLADLPRMIEAIKEADPLLAGAALLASVFTYIGSAMALAGSIPAKVRIRHSLLAAVAATFVGAVAPPGVAHVGLNVRFAQKQGMPPPAAVSATAAKEVVVAAAHIGLLILMAIMAGSASSLEAELERLPSWQTIAIFVSILLAALGIAAAIPKVRQIVVESVIPAVRHSMVSLRELAGNPVKMSVLFSGAVLLQVAYVTCLYLSVRALGGEVDYTTIGLIYLTVGSAAAVAPTPGGVGAVEAVLLAALTGIGMAAAPALAAVFLYRLVTFWAPIPVGGLAMRYMVGHNLL